MYQALLGGGLTLLGGAALVPQAIDAYRWLRPDHSDLEQQVLASPLDAAGNPILTKELKDAIWRAGKKFPGGINEWAQKTRLAAKKREWEESPEGQWNRERIAQADRLAADERKYRRTQDALARTDQMIAQQRADDLERWTRQQTFDARTDELGLRRDTMENNIALQRLDLLDRQGRQDWQQQQFEKQLTLDEEQRVRDQRKFYALLGQSILSEGVRAFF